MRMFVEDDPVGNWKSRRQGKCLFLGIKGLIFVCLFVFLFCFFFGGGGGGQGGVMSVGLAFDTSQLLVVCFLEICFNKSTQNSLRAESLFVSDNWN